jgi:hypothetical protein
MIDGGDGQQRLPEQARDGEFGPRQRKRKEQEVQRSVLEAANKVVGQSLPDVEAQFGITEVQIGDHERQEIRAQRLHDSDPDRPREQVCPRRAISAISATSDEDPPRARGDFLPLGRHHDAGPRSLHQLHPKLVLQL